MPRAVVHVDLDGARHIYRTHGWQAHPGPDTLFLTGLRNLLDFLDASVVRATLFVIAEDVRDPAKLEVLREAVRRGHEIASHSVTHPHLSGLPDEPLADEIRRSRDLLADALGVVPRGFRAPAFSTSRRVLEALAAAGYTWDSSVFPTSRFATALGVPRIPSRPWRPLPGSALIELPLPAFRPLPLPFHPSYSLVLGVPYFRIGLARFRQTGAPLVLLFHLTDLAEPLSGPRGWRARLYTLSHLSASAKRSRCAAMLDLVGKSYTVVDTPTLIREVADASPVAAGVHARG